MCGIAGILGPADPDALGRMAEALRHRGPDDRGVWMDPSGMAGFAHTRLSILDLTSAGHQPMVSADGRRALVYNGEIYNHLELREEIARHLGGEPAWHGHSDTETLLRAFEIWGVEDAIKKCRGMFAFGWWDSSLRTLILGRDRMGEKPLYYGWQGKNFFFASEIPAICAHPDFRRDLDQEALGAYLCYGYVPAPLSVYRGIRKLPPGTLLTVGADGPETPEPTPYWSLVEVASRGCAHRFGGSEDEAVEVLERLIGASVARQRLSDVPLGAFLSGGIDSSLVTAFLQRHSGNPASTFTMGFNEDSHDEAAQARAVAEALGTSHHELYLSGEQARSMIPSLPAIYGEPFADPSQIPTLLVSKFARQSVSVSLSGDGGDELFCGYQRYHGFQTINSIPGFVRGSLGALLSLLSPQGWQAFFSAAGRVIPALGRQKFAGDRIHKAARILRARDFDAMYLAFLSQGHGAGPREEFSDLLRELGRRLPSPQARLMAFDGLTYLPDDVLCKVDRAAMSVSLETRIPLLDHEIVEFAWTLPLSFNVRNGRGKWLLRRLLMKYLPADLVERPKRGFAVPIAEWLRGPLKEWAGELLSDKLLRENPLFDVGEVRRKWREHQEGARNWHYQLWNILMLQAWLRHARFI